MIIAGIDFSIKSTSICIKKDKTYHWLIFPDNVDYNKKGYTVHKILNDMDCVDIISYDRNVPKGAYEYVESYKLNNAKYLAETVLRNIKDFNIDKIGFEGYSFASKGNAFIDLITYNSFLRSTLINNKYPINVFAPSHVKKIMSGKGNANKMVMYDSFINSEDQDLQNTQLWKFVKEENYKESLPKPIDDVIDSFAVALALDYSI